MVTALLVIEWVLLKLRGSSGENLVYFCSSDNEVGEGTVSKSVRSKLETDVDFSGWSWGVTGDSAWATWVTELEKHKKGYLNQIGHHPFYNNSPGFFSWWRMDHIRSTSLIYSNLTHWFYYTCTLYTGSHTFLTRWCFLWKECCDSEVLSRSHNGLSEPTCGKH